MLKYIFEQDWTHPEIKKLTDVLLDILVVNNLTEQNKNQNIQHQIKKLTEEFGYKYNPKYKELNSYKKEFDRLTTEFKNIKYNEQIENINPDLITFQKLLYIKDVIQIKNIQFQRSEDLYEEIILNCSHSEPHNNIKIVRNNSIYQRKYQTTNHDYEMIGTVTINEYELDIFKMLEDLLERDYQSDPTDLKNRLLLILIENININLVKALFKLVNLKLYQVVTNLNLKTFETLNCIYDLIYENFFFKRNETFLLMAPTLKRTTTRTRTLGGFSLYLKENIYNFCNVYVKNTYAGRGLTKEIFKELDRIQEDFQISIEATTKSPIMEKRFEEFGWKYLGQTASYKTDQTLFVPEEMVWIKSFGSDDTIKEEYQAYSPKFVTEELFCSVQEIDTTDQIFINEFILEQLNNLNNLNSLNDLTYHILFALYLDKRNNTSLRKTFKYNQKNEYSTFIGYVSQSNIEIHNLQRYKVSPHLMEADSKFLLFKIKDDFLVVPEYNGIWLNFEKPKFELLNKKYTIEYQPHNQSKYLNVIVNVKDTINIIKNVYGEYEEQPQYFLKKIHRIPVDSNLFRQDFEFIGDSKEFQALINYIDNEFINDTEILAFIKECTVDFTSTKMLVTKIKKILEKYPEREYYLTPLINSTIVQTLEHSELFGQINDYYVNYNNNQSKLIPTLIYLWLLEKAKL